MGFWADFWTVVGGIAAVIVLLWQVYVALQNRQATLVARVRSQQFAIPPQIHGLLDFLKEHLRHPDKAMDALDVIPLLRANPDAVELFKKLASSINNILDGAKSARAAGMISIQLT